MSVRYALCRRSLGWISIAASDDGLCTISLGDDRGALVRALRGRYPDAAPSEHDQAFDALVANVVGLAESPATHVDLPMDLRGTPFEQRVWQALREIPAGTTASYSEIAMRIDAPDATRDVADACAANPLAVVIPCHRVVRKDGTLGGYRWGVARKRTLLAREGVVVDDTNRLSRLNQMSLSLNPG